MPPKEKKERTTNFRSFETQSRLLAALVASLDNHRFDYKKIAKLYGGSATESAMEHRFRALKCQAELLRALVNRGVDPEPYRVYEIKNKEEIQKYFGASTPDGIGFQFRSINKGANTLKAAVAKGEDPVEAFAAQLKGGPGLASSVPNTPSHPRTTAASTKRARPVKATPGSGSAATPASKRRKPVKIEPISDVELDDDVDSSDVDYSELDFSPSKQLKPKVLSTPKKNPGSLLPHSAWAKPAPKTENDDSQPAPRPRHVAIAPPPAAPAAPSPSPYTLAPIAGLASATPAVPNGYTNPATSLAYNYIPADPLSSSATPSGTNSPAPVALPTRRGSAFSASSFTPIGSSPVTPTLGFSDPAAPAANGAGTVRTAANTAHTTGMSPPIVISSSPTPSIIATAPAPAPTNQQPQRQRTQPASTGITMQDDLFTPFAASANSGTNHHSHNAHEARFAVELDFGGFGEEDDEDDMGDI
ncbi:hypothetical protein C8A05DRAFT_31925 [Staphylotrichum tortipilum]|uniref:Uncharacterized protein n=1 Tax=Staphylotrichum tortipilum TaxID=2831512 RepID=A0AAN6MQU5_9PEZI|nr:hypothetical protein C8A05DRAFT_31925 [Staphylotrichum longicolle]